jgi:hypothetical protein
MVGIAYGRPPIHQAGIAVVFFATLMTGGVIAQAFP